MTAAAYHVFYHRNGVFSKNVIWHKSVSRNVLIKRGLFAQSGNIRTIIKARGLKHPNFYGYKTFAVFRADRDHNLISLVSKIGKSWLFMQVFPSYF